MKTLRHTLSLLLCLLPPALRAGSTCEDSLSISNDRYIGKPLAGVATEAGDLVWQSTAMQWTADKVVSASSTGTAAAWVPLSSPPDVLRLKVKILPQGCDWMGVALGSQWDTASNFLAGSRVRIRFNPGAHLYWVTVNGTDVVSNGALGTGYQTVEFWYSKPANTVTVYLNDISLGSFPTGTPTLAFTGAGVFCHNVSTSSSKPALAAFSAHDAGRETFTRPEGTGMNTVAIELGDQPSWNTYPTTSGPVQVSGGALTTTSTLSAASSSASLPLPNPPDYISVKAGLKPQGTGWTALALGRAWDGNFYSTAALWVYLRPNGNYSIRADGLAKTLVAEQPLSGYSSSGYNIVELRYWKKTNTFAVSINGSEVLAPTSLNDLDYLPFFSSAGVYFKALDSGGGATLQPYADDFMVSYSTPTVSQDSEYSAPLSVYASGATPAFAITLRNAPGTTLTAAPKVKNYEGVVTALTNVACPVVGGVLHSRFPAPAGLANGYYQFIVDFSNGTTVKEPFAIVPMIDPAWANSSGNPFGGMVFPHVAYPWPDRERDARLMQRIGMNHVRTHRINWNRMQAASGSPINWDEADRELAIYERFKLNVIATTGWPVPLWASSANGYPYHPHPEYFAPASSYIGQYTSYFTALAARYQGRISYYEVGNETDAYFWMGDLAHFKTSDSPAIIGDYATYLKNISTAIHAGYTAAKVAPGTTAAVPYGALHPNWMSTLLGAPNDAGPAIDAFSTHYDADLPSIRAGLAQSNKQSVPIIITEIGGIRRSTETGELAFGASMKALIKEDYYQNTIQLRDGNVKALCKFMVREQGSYGGEGTLVSALVDNNFDLRPSYVAYATLINALAGSTGGAPLNVSTSTTAGWLDGYAFTDRSGQPVNVLFLNQTNGAPATVSLPVTGTGSRTLVDAMGRESAVTVSAGKITFVMNDSLPVIVKGQINPGSAPHAQTDTPADANPIVVPLANAGFSNTTLTNWSAMPTTLPSGATLTLDGTSGNFVSAPYAMKISTGSSGATSFFGGAQLVTKATLDSVAPLGTNQYYVFRVNAKVKGLNLDGMGLGASINIRASDYTILYLGDNGYFGNNGTFGWRDFECAISFDYWPAAADRLTLEMLLGPSNGSAWVDDVQLTVQRWNRAR